MTLGGNSWASLGVGRFDAVRGLISKRGLDKAPRRKIGRYGGLWRAGGGVVRSGMPGLRGRGGACDLSLRDDAGGGNMHIGQAMARRPGGRVKRRFCPTVAGRGQGAARNATANAHVVELVALRSQARLDVAQTLPVRQLGEGQAQKLFQAGKILDLVFAGVERHAPAKSGERQMLGQLRKNQLANVHKRYPRKWSSQDRSVAA